MARVSVAGIRTFVERSKGRTVHSLPIEAAGCGTSGILRRKHSTEQREAAGARPGAITQQAPGYGEIGNNMMTPGYRAGTAAATSWLKAASARLIAAVSAS